MEKEYLLEEISYNIEDSIEDLYHFLIFYNCINNPLIGFYTNLYDIQSTTRPKTPVQALKTLSRGSRPSRISSCPMSTHSRLASTSSLH